MLYDVLDAAVTPRTAQAPDGLGFLYNNGGLNNQKMAILGLLLAGCHQGRAVTLPYIYNKDQRSEQELLAQFGDIFEPGCVSAFAARHRVTITHDAPTGPRGGWEWFTAFNDELRTIRDTGSLRRLLDAVDCLRPRLAAWPEVRSLKHFLLASLGIETAVQLRIEADWREHVDQTLTPQIGDAEENGLGFAAIMHKVRTTFADLRLVYVTADEASMPASKDEIRTVCRSRFGIEPIWKSDLLPEAFQRRLRPLDLSLIDFEIAKACPRFVGLTTSTFANMLAMEKWANTGVPVRGHFIYNHPGETLVERRDNGLCSAAAGALHVTAAERLLDG